LQDSGDKIQANDKASADPNVTSSVQSGTTAARHPFVHLNVHTEYSLVDSIVRVKELGRRVAELEMPAVAVTDVANLFASIKFYRAAINNGIKPIIGVDAYIANEESPGTPWRLRLFARDEQGYGNLCELLTVAHQSGYRGGLPSLDVTQLEQRSNGLIALSGHFDGEISASLISDNEERAKTTLRQYQSLFGDDFYFEISRLGRPSEEEALRRTVTFAAEQSIAVVATNPVCFLDRHDFDSHEVRVCINDRRPLSDMRRPRRHTDQQYLRSAEEMLDLFSDLPEAVTNSVEVAKRCNVRLTLDEAFMPAYPLAEGISAADQLSTDSSAGLEVHLTSVEFANDRKREHYLERLELELNVISKMGFPGYFLIVADFIRWSREKNIPVGPGRGSGAGSLVAWSLGITDIDPLQHGLLFERFLNPERVSLPDFDIDFCMEGRDAVIEYVSDRYGRERVSQIITYGTMAAKAVVRDVGRAMDLSFGFVSDLAKLIPFEVGMTLEKAFEQEPLLHERYAAEADVQELIDTARVLEGIARNVGKHAGGVVIAPSALTDFTPLYCEEGSTQSITQLDKDDLETIGLVKFDFLGLRTLTIIDWALKNINRNRAKDDILTLDSLDMTDDATFKLVQSGRTTSMFQLESQSMKNLIRQLKPDCFEDLVALVALHRPGPMGSGMVDNFVDRKHGREAIDYPHQNLTSILSPTYGVILYQEQVMQIAQVLAGYTLGAADLLRRAMGKKKPEEMEKQRSIFLAGSAVNGIDDSVASYIFDLMEKFAGYGFNKSHSAAYAILTYQTAWLKTHHTAAFMAAALSSDMDKTDRVVALVHDCRSFNLMLAGPDINESGYHFTPRDKESILYGLGAIKGVGQAAIESIIEERENNGVFADIFELCQRVDGRKVNRRVLEALIRSGALDSLGGHRAAHMATISLAMSTADQQTANTSAGQNDMFGIDASEPQSLAMPAAEVWSDETRLLGERETLGFYLSGHPLDKLRDELLQLTGMSVEKISIATSNKITLAGLVSEIRLQTTQNGKGRIAFLTLDDGTGQVVVKLFNELYTESRELIRKDELLLVHGSVVEDRRDGSLQIRVEKIVELDELRRDRVSAIGISLQTQIVTEQFLNDFQHLIGQHSSGNCDVIVLFKASDGTRARLRLGPQWQVNPSGELIDALQEIPGVGKVRLRISSLAEETNDYYRSPDALQEGLKPDAATLVQPSPEEMAAATEMASSELLH